MKWYNKLVEIKKWRKETIEKEDAIFKQWRKKWDREIRTLDLEDIKDGDVFAEWLETAYQFARYKAQNNRGYNFGGKFIYIAVTIVSVLIYIAMISWDMLRYSHDLEEITVTMISAAVSFFPVILLLAAITRLLRVRKYQETWSRYTRYYTLLLQEMTKYIYGIPPYQNWDKQKNFMESILSITDNNVKKFNENMEKKEEKLMSLNDFADIIKKLK